MVKRGIKAEAGDDLGLSLFCLSLELIQFYVEIVELELMVE